MAKKKTSTTTQVQKPNTSNANVQVHTSNDDLLAPENFDFKTIDMKGAKNPFLEVKDKKGESPLHGVVNLLHNHGPALAKLLLMVATIGATLFACYKVIVNPPAIGGSAPDQMAGFLIAAMIFGCATIVECMFAYSWVKKGSRSIAGKQVEIIDAMHKVTMWVMIGTLITMQLEAQAGLHVLFIAWTSIVDPIAAVYLINAMYRLKGAHPKSQAIEEAITLEAEINAERVREQVKNFKVLLGKAQNRRRLATKRTRTEREEQTKLTNSRRFRRMIKAEQEGVVFEGETGNASSLLAKAKQWFMN